MSMHTNSEREAEKYLVAPKKVFKRNKNEPPYNINELFTVFYKFAFFNTLLEKMLFKLVTKIHNN